MLIVLDEWKQQHGNRNPKTAGGGLLDIPGTGEPIDFDTATPWQCTDYPFENATSLTLRLLYEQFPSAIALRDQVTEINLMATLLIQDDGGKWDWFRAYRAMLQALIPEAQKRGEIGGAIKATLANLSAVAVKTQRDKALKLGRPQGVKARQKKAAKNQADLTGAITALFDAPGKPGWGWSNPTIVKFLLPRFSYAEGTILTAVKREAAKHRKARKERLASEYLSR